MNILSDTDRLLESAEIRRSGLTTSGHPIETTKCSMSLDKEKKSIKFSFWISAAGGGRTYLTLEIGKKDFVCLLNDLISLVGSDLKQTFKLKK